MRLMVCAVRIWTTEAHHGLGIVMAQSRRKRKGSGKVQDMDEKWAVVRRDMREKAIVRAKGTKNLEPDQILPHLSFLIKRLRCILNVSLASNEYL